MKITSVNIRRKTSVWTAVLKPLPTVKFSHVIEIVSTYQSSCQWTTGRRNVATTPVVLTRTPGNFLRCLQLRRHTHIVGHMSRMKSWSPKRHRPTDSFLVAFYRLCFDSSCCIVIASVLSDLYPWRYDSNLSLQIPLPCSSYSALVTHILLRNVSVLDRETPPSHACVIGLEQRWLFRNDDSSGSGIALW